MKNVNNVLNISTKTKKPNGYWTKETVFEESKKFTNRCDFSKKSSSAYTVAWKNKWLDDMPWLILQRHVGGHWTKTAVILESQKYKTKIEFNKKNGTAYNAACKHKWIKEMTWLEDAKRPNGYWTKERIMEEAKKYNTKNDFRKNCVCAYNTACHKNFLTDISKIWK